MSFINELSRKNFDIFGHAGNYWTGLLHESLTAEMLGDSQHQDFVQCCRNGNWMDALNGLDDLIRAHQKNPLLHSYRGFLNALIRDHVKAEESCRLAIENPSTEAKELSFSRHLPILLFQSEYLLRGKSSHVFESSLFDPDPDYGAHEKFLAKHLPAVEHVYLQQCGLPHTFFAMTDAAYFKQWAIPLVLSAIDNGLTDGFHIHIVNPDEDCAAGARRLRDLLGGKFGFSFERTEVEKQCQPPIYYSCIRFCRMFQLLGTGKFESCTLIDADMLFNQLFSDWHRHGQAMACVIAKMNPMMDICLAGLRAHIKNCRGASANFVFHLQIDQVQEIFLVSGSDRHLSNGDELGQKKTRTDRSARPGIL